MQDRKRQRADGDIQAIRQSLYSIADIFVRALAALESAQSNGASPAPPATVRQERTSVALSPARRSALKLQGEYMGRLRNLPPRDKAQVKALRAKKGIVQAIRLAAKLARTS